MVWDARDVKLWKLATGKQQSLVVSSNRVGRRFSAGCFVLALGTALCFRLLPLAHLCARCDVSVI